MTISKSTFVNKTKGKITSMHVFESRWLFPHSIYIVNRILLLKSCKINIFQKWQIAWVELGLLYVKQKKKKDIFKNIFFSDETQVVQSTQCLFSQNKIGQFESNSRMRNVFMLYTFFFFKRDNYLNNFCSSSWGSYRVRQQAEKMGLFFPLW